MSKRHQTIEIYAPTLGIKKDAPATMLDARAQPDGKNAMMFYGSNMKDFGTTYYCTGTTPSVGTYPSMIFDAKFPGSSVLQIANTTGVYKYTSGSDSFVSDGQTFTGTFTDCWNGYFYNDQFLYTNGVDPIQLKASVGATGTNWVCALSPTTYKAWSIGVNQEHLNLYHTVEGGTEFFKRVRWATKGALPATTAFQTGVAGAIDLVDVEGEIKGACSLGIVSAIYSDRSIHIQNWVGGDQVFQFQKTISGIGCPSRRGFLSIGDANYFIGQNSFYAYYGGTDLRDIGDPISKFAFSQINRTNLGYSFVSYDPYFDEVYFHVPMTTDTQATAAWVYRVQDSSWMLRDRPYSAKGSSTRVNAITIGDLQGSIGQQNYLIGDTILREGAEFVLYGDSTGRIVKRDRTVFSMIAANTTTAQAYSYVTPDIVGLAVGGSYNTIRDPYTQDPVKYTTTVKRWLQMNMEIAGSGSAYVSYSTDFGTSFIPVPQSPFTMTATPTTFMMDLDVSSRQIRFKVTNTGLLDNIALTYAKVEFVPGSESYGS